MDDFRGFLSHFWPRVKCQMEDRGERLSEALCRFKLRSFKDRVNGVVNR